MTQNMMIAGYAARFDTPDSSGDLFDRQAFEGALDAPQGVQLLWQHQAANPVGRIIRLLATTTGLWVEAELNADLRLAREAISLIQASALTGLSVGFRTFAASPREAGRIRLIQDVELWEISLVTFPMHPNARIERFAPTEHAGPASQEDWAQTLAGINRLARRVSAAA